MLEKDETSGTLHSDFMHIEINVQLLTEGIKGRDSIPFGRKENFHFIINYLFNAQRR